MPNTKNWKIVPISTMKMTFSLHVTADLTQDNSSNLKQTYRCTTMPAIL